MKKINKEWEWGYCQGYDAAQYQGLRLDEVFKHLRERGISMRTTFAVAFRQAVKDYKDGKPRQYTYYDQ